MRDLFFFFRKYVEKIHAGFWCLGERFACLKFHVFKKNCTFFWIFAKFFFSHNIFTQKMRNDQLSHYHFQI